MSTDPNRTDPMPTSAYTALDQHTVRSSALTRGPWDPGHQHAGPPIAWVCGHVERVAQGHGLTHIGRITASLLRPVPVGDLSVEVAADYVGRNAGHFSARLFGAGKELARLTILAQRENDVPLPADLPGHPAPQAPLGPLESPPATFPFASRKAGYADLVETRVARGQFFKGPCTAWFRLRHPLLEGQVPSAYQRVAVAADSGNGVSAVLNLAQYIFVNNDLTINLLRKPQGEWICLDAQTHLGPNGCGLAHSRLFDTQGLVGTATQSLAVRLRHPG